MGVDRQSSTKQQKSSGGMFSFCKKEIVDEYLRPSFYVLKHEMLNVEAVMANFGENCNPGWHAMTFLGSGRGFAPIFGGPCHDSTTFWCLWEAMPGFGETDIVKALDDMAGADIMRNTAYECATDKCWFPGDVAPFTLPRSPFDPVEDQRSAGQFCFVSGVTPDPAATNAKVGQLLAKGPEAVSEICINGGAYCHMCLHQADSNLAWALWEMDAGNGKTKADLEAHLKEHIFLEEDTFEIYVYNMGATPNLPSSVFAKNGTDLSITDNYALLCSHSADSAEAMRNFTNSPFAELLERHATDMGFTRYFSFKNQENNKYNLLIEGNQASVDKLHSLGGYAGWILDDPAKPVSGPINIKKLKCIQHSRWARTQEDLVEVGIGAHAVSDPEVWLGTFNSPQAGMMHKSCGIAETLVYFETERNAIYVIHKVLKGRMDDFKKVFSHAAFDHMIEGFIKGGMPADLVQKPIQLEYCDIIARKTLGLRAQPAPLKQTFSIITECTVADVGAVVKQFEATKMMYAMTGFEEFNILQDLDDPKRIMLIGTFSNSQLVDCFKADTKDESDFAKLYLPAGVVITEQTPCTTYVTRQCEKYGWALNKRRVGEFCGYFRHSTESAAKVIDFRGSEKWQCQIQSYGVSAAIPNSQIAVHSSNPTKNREDQHVLLFFPQKELVQKAQSVISSAVESFDNVPFLKKANELGHVILPMCAVSREVIAAL